MSTRLEGARNAIAKAIATRAQRKIKAEARRSGPVYPPKLKAKAGANNLMI